MISKKSDVLTVVAKIYTLILKSTARAYSWHRKWNVKFFPLLILHSNLIFSFIETNSLSNHCYIDIEGIPKINKDFSTHHLDFDKNVSSCIAKLTYLFRLKQKLRKK